MPHRAELLQDEEEFDENAVTAVGDEDEEKDKDKDKDKDTDKEKSANKIAAKSGTTSGSWISRCLKFQNISCYFRNLIYIYLHRVP